MKNLKILAVGGGARILTAAITLACLGQPLYVDAKEPRISDELFDYRNLDEKFTNRNEDFIMDFKKDYSPNNESDYNPIYVTAKDFNKKPGTVIASDSDFGYVISVPEIRQDGEITDKLDGYGVLEIFKYGYSEGQYEYWYAESELILFDKPLFYNHPITINAAWLNGGPYVYSNLPMLEYDFFSAEYGTAEEVESMSGHEAKYYYSYFRDDSDDSWRDDNLKGVSFTKNSMNFSAKQLDKMILQSEQCNLLCRDSIKKLDHGDSFDIQALFNTFSGPMAGMFEIRSGYNGFDYIYSTKNPAAVIALAENKIYIGISARGPWEDIEANVKSDIIYTDLVYEDKTENPEMVSIGYQTLTRGTLDELLRLLMDPDVIWSDVGVLDLDVG